MAGRSTLRDQLQEHRHLIEAQRIEMRRQQRQMDVQVRRTADLQAELDVIKATLQRAAPVFQPTQGSPPNGNGHRAARPLRSETTMSARDVIGKARANSADD